MQLMILCVTFVTDLFQSCVVNKVTKRITNRIWSDKKSLFCTTIPSRFAKRPSYEQNLHQCSLLIIPLNLSGLWNMGSFLIILFLIILCRYRIYAENTPQILYLSLEWRETTNMQVGERVLFTLEYDCTDTLGPRCTDIFKANLTGADILAI